MPDTNLLPVWSHELAAAGQASTQWLWQGFIAAGNITLLTGNWKIGKTTLLTHLLRARHLGGQLLDRAVAPGKTAVLTEESLGRWSARLASGLGDSVCIFARPFKGIPTPAQWKDALAAILNLHEAHDVDLLVLDPLAPLVQNENNAKIVLDLLLPVRVLTDASMAVLAMHHPTKMPTREGNTARGSGALLGHVDISAELRHPGGDPRTRKRRLVSLSRFSETPRSLLFELSSDETCYHVLDDTLEDGFSATWPVLVAMLKEASQPLTCDDIRAEWPSDFDKVSPTSLRRWLTEATQRGMVERAGSGRKADPFRYWLKERAGFWENDPFYRALEQQRLRSGQPFKSLSAKKAEKQGDEPCR